MKYTLGKHQKLKSRKAISQLFQEGKSVKNFPIKMIYVPVNSQEESITKVAFSVPKRNFKLAVHRNKVKRLLREAYRLHQQEFLETQTAPYHVMFVYMGATLPTYTQVTHTLKKLFQKFKSSQSIL